MLLYKIRHIKTGKYLNDAFNPNKAYFSNETGKLFTKKSEVGKYIVWAIKRHKIIQEDYAIESFELVSRGDLDSNKEIYLSVEKAKKYDLKYESSRLISVMKATLKEVL